ncbi:FAD-binding domain-containing protein [Metabacillus arenae]|nr:FAD-binding domain-containing protein [Metabacillus arenae]
MNVVWFKRDLRIADHQPLYEACKYEEVFPLYIVEPSIWALPDLSIRHFQFVVESLLELKASIEERGGKLFLFIGEMEEALNEIYETFGMFQLFTHEENETMETNFRDTKVRQWMKEKGLPYYEYQQIGVVSKCENRYLFQKKWSEYMNNAILEAPSRVASPSILPNGFFIEVNRLNSFHVKGERIRFGQVGGESKAIETLESFLEERSKSYQLHLSKPIQSTASSSRLSPYLAWGNISLRTIVKKTEYFLGNCENLIHKKQLKAFSSRLKTNCSLIQRIEDEQETIIPAFDNVRTDWDEKLFQAWLEGRTGVPMVDAVMRCLHKTGWVNFTSRAIAVSFICNTLLMDWKKPSHVLASLFLDYEPGIHYNQIKLQAGISDIKKMRIYNPVRLGKNLDPTGEFIKRYVKELKAVPEQYIHEPWLYPGFFQLGYPAPIIDIDRANQKANELLRSMKGNGETQDYKQSSRKKNNQNQETEESEQLSFDL